MRSVPLVLFVFLIYNGKAQDTTTFNISKTISVESVSKDELYNRAKRWIAAVYPLGQDVIQSDDKENNTVTVISFFSVSANNDLMTRLEDGTVKYNLTIQCTDGNCKYSLQNFIHQGGEGYGSGGNLNNIKPDCGIFRLPKMAWQDIKKQAGIYLAHLQYSIEQGMNNNAGISKSSDW